MLIAFEGIHNCGKSTTIKRVSERLIKKGKKVYITEWNSHPIIKDILYELRDKNKLCNSLLYIYMQMLDFVYRYELDIVPKLKEGYIVLADRYLLTAMIRCKIRNFDEEVLKAICNNVKKADYCFVLDVPVQISINRGIPKDNSVWQAGLNIEFFDDVFDFEGYFNYLSLQRNLYINLAEEENAYIIENEDIDVFTDKIFSILNV